MFPAAPCFLPAPDTLPYYRQKYSLTRAQAGSAQQERKSNGLFGVEKHLSDSEKQIAGQSKQSSAILVNGVNCAETEEGECQNHGPTQAGVGWPGLEGPRVTGHA